MDDLGDDEVEPLLGEGRIELRLLGDRAQAGDLGALALRIGGRHPVRGLEAADLLGELESLREHVHEGGVDVVDTEPQTGQISGDILLRHRARLPGVPPCLSPQMGGVNIPPGGSRAGESAG